MSTVSAPVVGLPASRVKAVALDLFERAGWTAGQQFVAVLLTTSTITAAGAGGLPWELASVMAAGAAVVSIVTTLLQYLSAVTRKLAFWEDLAMRLAKTFLASLLAAIGASAFNVLEFDWASALNLAAITTLAALGKGLLAREPGGPEGAPVTPSTLPARTYLESTGGPRSATL